MAHGAFGGRISLKGNQFLGTVKQAKLGIGRLQGHKTKTHAPTPGPAFDTPGMDTAAKIAMPVLK